MKLSNLLILLPLLAAAPAARSAMTVITFDGGLNTLTGPGSMANVGELANSFDTVSGFGLNAMAGGNPIVMAFAAPSAPDADPPNTPVMQGLSFTHAGATPNTTGYTILLDIYYPTIPNFVSLLQLDNADDGELFGRGSGSIGISGNYAGTSFTANAWHRVMFTMNADQTDMEIYLDGALANPGPPPAEAIRYNLSNPSFLILADEDGETAAGYISAFAFDDRTYSAQEVAALGGTSAIGVPEPTAAGLMAAAGALGLLSRRRRQA